MYTVAGLSRKTSTPAIQVTPRTQQYIREPRKCLVYLMCCPALPQNAAVLSKIVILMPAKSDDPQTPGLSPPEYKAEV